MNTDYLDDVERNGFAVIEHFVDSKTVDSLLGELANAGVNNLGSQRSGRVFGLRNLLYAVPFTRTFANSASLRSLVEPILGSSARVVSGLKSDRMIVWVAISGPKGRGKDSALPRTTNSA